MTIKGRKSSIGQRLEERRGKTRPRSSLSRFNSGNTDDTGVQKRAKAALLRARLCYTERDRIIYTFDDAAPFFLVAVVDAGAPLRPGAARVLRRARVHGRVDIRPLSCTRDVEASLSPGCPSTSSPTRRLPDAMVGDK